MGGRGVGGDSVRVGANHLFVCVSDNGSGG